MALKTTFAVFTNSISIYASAVDSLFDLSASVVNYLSIRKAEKPADLDHRFGHGKAEGLGGLFQSFIISFSSLYLIYNSALRLVSGSPVESLETGISVMAFSAAAGYLISRYLEKVGEKTESVALKADSLHYRTDVFTSLGVILGLVLIRLTGLHFIDPVVSLLVAAYIIRSSWGVLRESLDILMDRELPDETIRQIEEIILDHKPVVKGFHKMRTRRSGTKRFIEFHLVLDHALSFVESHDLAEHIIQDIENRVESADVTVHVDPYSFPDYS
ncbi:MAG: cation diffusion facilitator family transporter [Deltaproteobacteria bacterium]